MAPLERSWEKMNRLAWGAFNWPHSSPRKAQSTQWEEKEEALSFLAVGGLQGPHWRLCSGQAGFWLSGPWLTMALAYKGKHGTVSRRTVVSNETSQKPKPNPTKTQKHSVGATCLCQGAGNWLPMSPGKALLSTKLFKHRMPVSFPVTEQERDF